MTWRALFISPYNLVSRVAKRMHPGGDDTNESGESPEGLLEEQRSDALEY